MRVSFGVVVLCAAAAGLALPVAGQDSRSQLPNVRLLNLGNPSPASRLPYTAVFKISRVQKLVNGSTITHESTEVVALDAQGRRMTATTTVPLSGDQTPITRVSVSDPVSRTNSIWTVPDKKATVTAMPTPGAARTGCAPPVTASVISNSTLQRVQREKPTVEDLGTETIQGIETRGRRFTTTTPAGTIGNDAPLVRTTETWTAIAPGLRGLMARDVTDDQQWGKMTKELTNFTQAEPDASVFQPPADYEIVNKPAPGSACFAEEGTESPAVPIPPPPPPQ